MALKNPREEILAFIPEGLEAAVSVFSPVLAHCPGSEPSCHMTLGITLSSLPSLHLPPVLQLQLVFK